MTDVTSVRSDDSWPIPLAQHRVDTLGRNAGVASSHPAISFEGARILSTGGNAVDASLAMAAVAWMVLPGQCGIGGDLFAIVREPDGQVWTVGGSGFGPDGGTPEFYARGGSTTIPPTGPLSVSVPGAAGALAVLARHASRPLRDLWDSGIRLARDGFVCTAKTHADINEYAASLQADPGTAAVFTPGGQVPDMGEILFQAQLADTLEWLADDPRDFYHGDFADMAVRWLRDAGAPFSGAEWALGGDVDEQPSIRIRYGDGMIHQTPLPTPGWMVLYQAALLDGHLAPVDLLGDQAVHAFASAARMAFDHRLAKVAADNDAWRDALAPDRVAADRAFLLSGGSLGGQAAGITVDGDTTTSVCVDSEGRAVSLIHSLAFTFGARISLPGTGVVLNNRLARGSYLLPGHPNEVQPRRKPLHTLNAWIYDHPRKGLLHIGNCPGGDGQVQWNMQVISHLVDHGLGPQRSVSLPRITVYPGSDADVIGRPQEVRVEPGISPRSVAALRRRGLNIIEVAAQTGGPGGSAMVISRDPATGVLAIGADPRMEGTAIAI